VKHNNNEDKDDNADRHVPRSRARVGPRPAARAGDTLIVNSRRTCDQARAQIAESRRLLKESERIIVALGTIRPPAGTPAPEGPTARSGRSETLLVSARSNRALSLFWIMVLAIITCLLIGLELVVPPPPKPATFADQRVENIEVPGQPVEVLP
jgi:hypothetical protein